MVWILCYPITSGFVAMESKLQLQLIRCWYQKLRWFLFMVKHWNKNSRCSCDIIICNLTASPELKFKVRPKSFYFCLSGFKFCKFSHRALFTSSHRSFVGTLSALFDRNDSKAIISRRVILGEDFTGYISVCKNVFKGYCKCVYKLFNLHLFRCKQYSSLWQFKWMNLKLEDILSPR